jgi:hypothetical protein
MGNNKERLNTTYFSTRKELVYRVICENGDGWYIKIIYRYNDNKDENNISHIIYYFNNKDIAIIAYKNILNALNNSHMYDYIDFTSIVNDIKSIHNSSLDKEIDNNLN